MIIYCEATIENPAQRDNLCECINIIAGIAKVENDKVKLEFEGSKEKCELLINLFEQYPRHGMFVVS